MISLKSAATLILFEVLSSSNSTSNNPTHFPGDGHRHRTSSLTPFHKTIILGMVYVIVAASLLLICCWHIQVKEAGKRYVYTQIKDSKEEIMYTPSGKTSSRVIASQIVYSKSPSKKKSMGIAPSSSSSSEEDSDHIFSESKKEKNDDAMEKGIALQDYHDDYSFHLNLSLSGSSKKSTSAKSSGRIPRIDPLRPPLHPFGTLQTPFQFGPTEVTSLKNIFPTAASYDATELDTKTTLTSSEPIRDKKGNGSPSPPPMNATTPSPDKSSATLTTTPSPHKIGDFNSPSPSPSSMLLDANHKFHRLMHEEVKDRYVADIDYFIRHRPDFYAPKYHYNIELLQQKLPPPSELFRRRSSTHASPSKISPNSSNNNNNISSFIIKNPHQQLAHHQPPSDLPLPKISHTDFVRFLKRHPGQLVVSANHTTVSLVSLTPYQGDGEVIGYFRCANVACRVLEVHWMSHKSRKDTPEICPRCHRLVYPYEQQQQQQQAAV